eukprot:m.319180 g.319180  ORF g.319180 m.319180 type:complete len:58 (+) comp23089_c0_seq2:189-362(+)
MKRERLREHLQQKERLDQRTREKKRHSARHHPGRRILLPVVQAESGQDAPQNLSLSR